MKRKKATLEMIARRYAAIDRYLIKMMLIIILTIIIIAGVLIWYDIWKTINSVSYLPNAEPIFSPSGSWVKG